MLRLPSRGWLLQGHTADPLIGFLKLNLSKKVAEPLQLKATSVAPAAHETPTGASCRQNSVCSSGGIACSELYVHVADWAAKLQSRMGSPLFHPAPGNAHTVPKVQCTTTSSLSTVSSMTRMGWLLRLAGA